MDSEQNKQALIRIEKDFADLVKNPPLNYVAHIQLNPFNWVVTIKGPQSTPYQNGYFHVYLAFSSQYPLQPPHCEFHTKIYHVNFKENETASLSIMGEDWSPYLSVPKILLVIHQAMLEPEVQTPINQQILKAYDDNIEEFENYARIWTKKYAQHSRYQRSVPNADKDLLNVDDISAIGPSKIQAPQISEIMPPVEEAPNPKNTIFCNAKEETFTLDNNTNNNCIQLKSPNDSKMASGVVIESSSVKRLNSVPNLDALANLTQQLNALQQECAHIEERLQRSKNSSVRQFQQRRLDDLVRLQRVLWERIMKIKVNQLKEQGLTDI